MDDIRGRFKVNRGNYGAPTNSTPPRRMPANQPQPVQQPTAQPKAQPRSVQGQTQPQNPLVSRARPVGRPMQDFKPAPKPKPVQSQGFGPFKQTANNSAQAQAPAQQKAKPAPTSPFASTSKKTKKVKTKKSGSKLKKVGVFASMLVLMLGLGGAGFYVYDGRYDSTRDTDENVAGASTGSETQTFEETEPAIQTGTITMLMTGDFIAYDSVNQRAKSGSGYDYSSMMAPMKSVFDKYDLKLCQQTSIGGGVELGVSGYPIFNAPLEWNEALTSNGCNLVATASRNAVDKGQQAIDNAVKFYEQSDVLAHSGINSSADDEPLKYFEYESLKFAFISYTTDSIKNEPKDFSVNSYSKASAEKLLGEARNEADFVIVAINWGKADDGAVQASQRRIAQELTTAGADLIVGSGPHITQYAEILEGKEGRQSLVWYSLGNAVSSQLNAEQRIGGLAFVDIDIATGNMTNPSFLPTYMHYEWTAAEKASNNFDARKNLAWYPLDKAESQLGKSLLGTSIDTEVARLEAIITSKAPVQMITTADLE